MEQLNQNFIESTLLSQEAFFQEGLYKTVGNIILSKPTFIHDSPIPYSEVLNPYGNRARIMITSGAGTKYVMVNEYELIQQLGDNQFVIKDKNGREYELEATNFKIYEASTTIEENKQVSNGQMELVTI